MKNSPRILLGGVPFGFNNIGDEAILSCIVNIIREECPHSHLTVCTADQANTAKLLNVDTCPAFGFMGNNQCVELFRKNLSKTDIFLWAGATGLSDYPDSGLRCLEESQKMRVKTVVFCTGMNETLNPAHFKLTKGNRHTLLTLLNNACGNKIDFVKTYDNRREAVLRNRIKDTLDKCDLVICRDVESQKQIQKSNLEEAPLVAADPAITLKVEIPNRKIWSNRVCNFMEDNPRKIGVCISSQQALVEISEFSKWLDHTIVSKKLAIVFIPMNPITDFETMVKIRELMVHKNRTIIAIGSEKPGDIAGLASEMDVVISSRLHLLIFASISATPCIGIGRGSKVNNFLKQLGQCTAGTTDKINFVMLEEALADILSRNSVYKEAAKIARTRMLDRLADARLALRYELIGGDKDKNKTQLYPLESRQC